MITGAIFLGYKRTCTYRSIRHNLLRFSLVLALIGTGFCAIERLFYCRALSLGLLGAAFVDMLKGNCWAHM